MNRLSNEALIAAQTRLIELRGDMQLMKNEILEGKLMQVEEYEKAKGKLITNVKSRLLALPVKAAPQCAGLDAREIEGILAGMVKEVLRELAESDE